MAPQASIWIDPAADVDSALEGIQVRIGDTVTVTDTSSDPNGNIFSVLVKWGNGKSVTTIGPGGTATYSYPKAGKKTITVTATDSKGIKSKTFKQKITVVN
jgi:PKD repeat protein